MFIYGSYKFYHLIEQFILRETLYQSPYRSLQLRPWRWRGPRRRGRTGQAGSHLIERVFFYNKILRKLETTQQKSVFYNKLLLRQLATINNTPPYVCPNVSTSVRYKLSINFCTFLEFCTIYLLFDTKLCFLYARYIHNYVVSMQDTKLCCL